MVKDYLYVLLRAFGALQLVYSLREEIGLFDKDSVTCIHSASQRQREQFDGPW